MAQRKSLSSVSAPSLYEGANEVYSDTNPPGTLQRSTATGASVPTPPAGQTTEFTEDGKFLLLKSSDAVVTRVGIPLVKAATTATVTLSTAGLATIDGVALVAGDYVLVKNQTAPAENGIYTASSTAWTRTTGFTSAVNLAGELCQVATGTVNGSLLFRSTLRATDNLGSTGFSWTVLIDGAMSRVLTTASVSQTFAATGFYQLNFGTNTVQGNDLSVNVSSQINVLTTGFYCLEAGLRLTTTGTAATRRLLAIESFVGTDPGLGNGTMLIADEVPFQTSVFIGLTVSRTLNVAAGTTLRAYFYSNDATSKASQLAPIPYFNAIRLG